MKVVKITKQQLFEMIQTEAALIRKEMNEASDKPITSLGDPIDVKMNPNDKLGDSDKATVSNIDGKTAQKKGTAKGLEDVKMNAQADSKSEKGDEKAATAVSVKAGAETKGNGPTTGLHKANFESKSENPKKEASAPFEEKAKEKMNSMDKENDEGTKTFVDAGAAKGGNNVTAGQHKAVVKEKAPKVKDKEPIAKGIEIKENYKKSELIAFIQEEAKKLAKKEMLSEELARLNEELKNL